MPAKEYDRRAVDHRHTDRLLEVALLARQQLVVDGDQIGSRLGDGALQLVQLAPAEVGVRIRMLAALDDLPRDRDARGAQQFLQLGQLVAPVRASSLGSTAIHNARWRARGLTIPAPPEAAYCDCRVRPFLLALDTQGAASRPRCDRAPPALGRPSLASSNHRRRGVRRRRTPRPSRPERRFRSGWSWRRDAAQWG